MHKRVSDDMTRTFPLHWQARGKPSSMRHKVTQEARGCKQGGWLPREAGTGSAVSAPSSCASTCWNMLVASVAISAFCSTQKEEAKDTQGEDLRVLASTNLRWPKA
jgi:hypothetical protein